MQRGARLYRSVSREEAQSTQQASTPDIHLAITILIFQYLGARLALEPVKLHGEIGPRVRALRQQRHWTQTELARQLDLSQPRLSQIERGDGSFTAEQFLQILELFNIGVQHFASLRTEEGGAALQNALARHGAAHLVTTKTVVPSEWEEPAEVVMAVLSHPESPRHVAALAPVLVANVDRIGFSELASRLARLGRERRLGWLAASVRAALADDKPGASADRLQARRADLVLDLFLETSGVRPPGETAALDVFDAEVRSMKSAERIFAEASSEARRWRIVTRLQTADFLEALRAARETR